MSFNPVNFDQSSIHSLQPTFGDTETQWHRVPSFPEEWQRMNGYILNGVALNRNALIEILIAFDSKDLITSLKVCRIWKEIIEKCVWRDKAIRQILGDHYKELPNLDYRNICLNIGRNLLKNNSGQNGFENWEILESAGDHGWCVETPPQGIRPDGTEDDDGPPQCFATSSDTECSKEQIIDLVANGIHPVIIDHHRTEIEVSEWYAARYDCSSYYSLHVNLLDENKTVIRKHVVKEEFMTCGVHPEGWKRISDTFKNYGPGVRYVAFKHSGNERVDWAGHYGSKMANAQVVVNFIRD